MKCVFKDGLKSEFVKNAMEHHLDHLQEKYPELENSETIVTLQMENSPTQSGPDAYTVKIRLSGSKRLKGISLQKTAMNFYVAVNEAFHTLTRKISNKISKKRTINRHRRRDFKHALELVGA